MLGLNAAVENHIRKHQKKPVVAMNSCSTLCVTMILLCCAGAFWERADKQQGPWFRTYLEAFGLRLQW